MSVFMNNRMYFQHLQTILTKIGYGFMKQFPNGILNLRSPWRATRAMGMGMDLQNYSIQNDDECEKVSVFSTFFFNFSLFVILIQSENVANR